MFLGAPLWESLPHIIDIKSFEMKKHKENNGGTESEQTVHTPEPPQVMDPSVPPEKQRGKIKDQKKDNQGSQKKKESISDEHKLSPKEEL